MFQELGPGKHMIEARESSHLLGIDIGVQNLPVRVSVRVQHQDGTFRGGFVEAAQEHEIVVLGVGHVELIEVGLGAIGAGDDGQAPLHPTHEVGATGHGSLRMPLSVFQGCQRLLGLEGALEPQNQPTRGQGGEKEAGDHPPEG